MTINYATGFHDQQLAHTDIGLAAISVMMGHWENRFTYRFDNFFHPFVGKLINRLNRRSLPGLMDPVWQAQLAEPFFDALYHPQNGAFVQVESQRKEIDVSDGGPYANYNWELFFHIPLTVAVHLSKTQRFAEAQRWFHYIFDPTSTDRSEDPPKRFWRFLAFRQDTHPRRIDDLLALLSTPESELDDTEKKERDKVLASYLAILNKPFQPHAVARTRHVAYQYNVVMKYLDNLIAWGDFLFQQDSIESINEATQRYVLAANILGPRPQQIPPRGTVQPKTYAQLKALPHDPMGNALVDLEAQFPFNFTGPSTGAADAASGPLFGIGRTLYFCIPRNDKLLGYWDTVADRLFKIRNCMNIAGIVRPLALFDPPIDPGMLVKAAAAGIDIGSIVSGLNQPIGPVRALPLIEKAVELCEAVRSLGTALQDALEKKDAEHLALVRQSHEIGIHQALRQVRFMQLKLAEETTQSLNATRDIVLERYKYFQRQLALPPDQNVPLNLKIKGSKLDDENFDDAYAALVATYDKPVTLAKPAELKKAGQNSPSQQAGAAGAGQLFLSDTEDSELNTSLVTARDLRTAASIAQTAAPLLSLIPDVEINLEYWGLGGSPTVFGGKKIAAAAKWAADVLRIAADIERDRAETSRRKSKHENRGVQWARQFNQAALELKEIGRRILTSLIAEQVARHELEQVRKQIENAEEIDRVLHERFTNEELYFWMQGEISRLYYEYYRFAFDVARKAEQTMKRELMRPELDAQDFVKFNYWDGGRKGLLSGEALHLDLKRMEMAYHDNNKRELELTRDVSLRQLDPIALLTLKSAGACQVTVPEWLYDRDCPGHYLRRIKTVSLSVVPHPGAGAGVYCTLSLIRSTIRKSPVLRDGEYARQGVGDDRFVDYAGAVQSIVTSHGDRDSGMFETNLQEHRFLPFEGSGAESTWKLDLPKGFPSFDYDAVDDVVLHIRYTARPGIPADKVTQALDDLFTQAAEGGPNFSRLFALQQDFPAAWTDFAAGPGPLQVTVRRNHFPYFTRGRALTITGMELYGQNVAKHHAAGDPAGATAALQAAGEFTFSAPPDPAGPLQVLVRNATTPVFLVVRYTL
jgi:Tc toxin complex TcA C-terminal TcB-binding domain